MYLSSRLTILLLCLMMPTAWAEPASEPSATPAVTDEIATLPGAEHVIETVQEAAGTLWEKAYWAFEQAEYATAIDHLERAIEESPSEITAYEFLGDLYYAAGWTAEGERAYAHAQIAPDPADELWRKRFYFDLYGGQPDWIADFLHEASRFTIKDGKLVRNEAGYKTIDEAVLEQKPATEELHSVLVADTAEVKNGEGAKDGRIHPNELILDSRYYFPIFPKTARKKTDPVTIADTAATLRVRSIGTLSEDGRFSARIETDFVFTGNYGNKLEERIASYQNFDLGPNIPANIDEAKKLHGQAVRKMIKKLFRDYVGREVRHRRSTWAKMYARLSSKWLTATFEKQLEEILYHSLSDDNLWDFEAFESLLTEEKGEVYDLNWGELQKAVAVEKLSRVAKDAGLKIINKPNPWDPL